MPTQHLNFNALQCSNSFEVGVLKLELGFASFQLLLSQQNARLEVKSYSLKLKQ